MSGPLAVTWWGHSSVTVELGSIRVGTDPVLVNRLMHLRRYAPPPTASAGTLDLVVVSHLHGDHLHVPSLASTSHGAPIIVPRGAVRLLGRLHGREIIEASPGDRLDVAGVEIEVLTAHHDGRRNPASRRHSPALGFRLSAEGHSVWYPGDTGLDDRMAEVDPVDLALVPIGGWGPSLGEHHLGPEEAAEAVARVGARWAVPVHWGTFWPAGLRQVHPSSHRRLFSTPGARFLEAMAAARTDAVPVLPAHGDRVVLDA